MSKFDELNLIARQVKLCQKCPLYKTATHAVPGEGNPEAQIFFIGEGPGYHEDQQGRPFVGAAGHLLDEMLNKIGLERREVFIGNMVKHRPPGNRDPQPSEFSACQEWIDKQLAIIQPQIVVTLGRFSMNKFIPDGKISRIHGQARFVELQGMKILVVPMFHPAAALRADGVMGLFKSDFLQLPNLLERLKNLVQELPKEEKKAKIEENQEKNEQMTLL